MAVAITNALICQILSVISSNDIFRRFPGLFYQIELVNYDQVIEIITCDSWDKMMGFRHLKTEIPKTSSLQNPYRYIRLFFYSKGISDTKFLIDRTS